MADAATIGANFSSYQGNVGLGGGTFGSGRIDTRPVEDLGRYIMLYNKAEFDQRQKNAESAAKEIADMTSYDLTSPIKKDADHLQNKYDKLLLFVRDNPNALDYRNKEKWAQYKSLRNDLENDLRGAKVRKTMYDLRLKEIADEPIVGNQKLRQQMLDKEVEETDIRTPLKHSQKYDVELPEMPTGQVVKFDVYKRGPNMDFKRDFEFLDMRSLNSTANAFSLDLNNIPVDISTPEGQFRQIARGQNFWLKGAEHLNEAIKSYKTPDGKLDESKLDNTSTGVINIAKNYNEYVAQKKSEIKAGYYRDGLGKNITFGPGMLNESDYKEVSYEDGISPEELAKLAAFAKWRGDAYKTTQVETDDAIQYEQIATTRRGQDLENSRFYAGLKYKDNEDLYSADAVLQEFADVIGAGVKTFIQDVKPNGQRVVKSEVLTISDPNLLREFGNIDKDGNVTNVPSKIYFDEKKNEFTLAYVKKDDEGNNVKINGNDVIERQVPISATQWLGQITRRKNPNKDIGGVNNLINTIYNKYNRNVRTLVDQYRGGVVQRTGGSSGSVSVSGSGSTTTPKKLIGPDGKLIN